MLLLLRGIEMASLLVVYFLFSVFVILLMIHFHERDCDIIRCVVTLCLLKYLMKC